MITLKMLTNDAKFLLVSMYKEYLSKRKSKLSKEKATFFGSVDEIHKGLMKEWTIEDTLFTCRELKRKNLITGIPYGEDSLIMISLSTDAIALMESKFKDDATEVIDFIVKIKSLIPFI